MSDQPNWPQLIKQERERLEMSQTKFGELFKVSHAAVSDWESGKSEAPYSVTWWLLTRMAETDDYQKGFHEGFKKAMWFVRQMTKLAPYELEYFEGKIDELIEDRI